MRDGQRGGVCVQRRACAQCAVERVRSGERVHRAQWSEHMSTLQSRSELPRGGKGQCSTGAPMSLDRWLLMSLHLSFLDKKCKPMTQCMMGRAIYYHALGGTFKVSSERDTDFCCATDSTLMSPVLQTNLHVCRATDQPLCLPCYRPNTDVCHATDPTLMSAMLQPQH